MSMNKKGEEWKRGLRLYASMRFFNIALVWVRTIVLGQEESSPIKEMMGNWSEEA